MIDFLEIKIYDKRQPLTFHPVEGVNNQKGGAGFNCFLILPSCTIAELSGIISRKIGGGRRGPAARENMNDLRILGPPVLTGETMPLIITQQIEPPAGAALSASCRSPVQTE